MLCCSRVHALCHFTDRGNRKWDAFLCLICGYASGADHVGAQNTKHRMTDRDITRHQRWLETEREAQAQAGGKLRVTVPGKTLETEGTASVGSHNAGGVEDSTKAGRVNHPAKVKTTAKAVHQRAKRKTTSKV